MLLESPTRPGVLELRPEVVVQCPRGMPAADVVLSYLTTSSLTGAEF